MVEINICALCGKSFFLILFLFWLSTSGGREQWCLQRHCLEVCSLLYYIRLASCRWWFNGCALLIFHLFAHRVSCTNVWTARHWSFSSFGWLWIETIFPSGLNMKLLFVMGNKLTANHHLSLVSQAFVFLFSPLFCISPQRIHVSLILCSAESDNDSELKNPALLLAAGTQRVSVKLFVRTVCLLQPEVKLKRVVRVNPNMKAAELKDALKLGSAKEGFMESDIKPVFVTSKSQTQPQ